MWPRSDATVGPGADMTATRRNKNAGLSGFVSFMKRRDAEAALREFDGYDWGGCVLRVGWSKAVPIAAKPMYGTHSFSCSFTFSVVTDMHDSCEEDISIKVGFSVKVTPQRHPSQTRSIVLSFPVTFQGQRSGPSSFSRTSFFPQVTQPVLYT